MPVDSGVKSRRPRKHPRGGEGVMNAAGAPPTCPRCGYPVIAVGDTWLHESPADGFMCSLLAAGEAS